MKAIVKHEGEVIATVQTTHSMSIMDALEVCGIDTNEQEGGEDKYDYNRMTIEMEQE